MKKFINLATNIVKYPLRELITIHGKLRTVTTHDLNSTEERARSIYQCIEEWLVEIISYGLCITIILYTLFGIGGGPVRLGATVIATGLLRWLIFDSIRELMEKVRSN